MKLGIIGAMEQEIETLLCKMQGVSQRECAGTVFYDGKLESLSVVVVRCGIGKVNAALCTQILCDLYEVTHIINTGIAGSLCAELDIGDIVISRDVMHHDVDCTVFGYACGQVPGMPEVYASDENLVQLAQKAAEEISFGHSRIGRVASGDQFVCSAEKKAQIVADTSAICTEMEGAAIAQTAYRNGVPFVVLRAISDKADNSAEMDYPTFEQQAAHHCAQLTQKLSAMLHAGQI